MAPDYRKRSIPASGSVTKMSADCKTGLRVPKSVTYRSTVGLLVNIVRETVGFVTESQASGQVFDGKPSSVVAGASCSLIIKKRLHESGIEFQIGAFYLVCVQAGATLFMNR